MCKSIFLADASAACHGVGMESLGSRCTAHPIRRAAFGGGPRSALLAADEEKHGAAVGPTRTPTRPASTTPAPPDYATTTALSLSALRHLPLSQPHAVPLLCPALLPFSVPSPPVAPPRRPPPPPPPAPSPFFSPSLNPAPAFEHVLSYERRCGHCRCVRRWRASGTCGTSSLRRWRRRSSPSTCILSGRPAGSYRCVLLLSHFPPPSVLRFVFLF